MSINLAYPGDHVARSKAALFRFLGIGSIAALAGVGVGVAFYGYATMAKTRVTTELLSDSMVRALEKTTLRTDVAGTVTVKDGQVALKPNQSVSLEPNATVGIVPDASVLVRGEISVAAPPDDRGRPTNQNSNAGTHNRKLLTNYTVFKNVQFGSGTVATGWNYASNKQASPSDQYCYYTERLDETAHDKINLGSNGQMATQGGESPIDVAEAFRNYVWFGGAR
jgi:hypothetical protein